ncbi:MAG: undecaprenyldiphospho-muramoylpentapeptide beta-N-acetylglucosaminyltransferase [Myxococcota bacterium]|nr:undecaprenyldiphospho-muramoylpentapeptide beta-N-acetylglucosaminyltransferase [Myxococcota bacterium]
MALSWIIAGGGTGGHVTPALALGEVIAERGEPVAFIGSQQGLESRWIPAAGFELIALPSQQVMGRKLLGRALGLIRTLLQVGRARSALLRCQADVVISVGGFAAVPAALAAWFTRTPLVLVEPNAVPGRVNQVSARVAQRIFVGFPEASAHLAKHAGRVIESGVPLRRALIAAFQAAPRRDRPHSPLRLLIFGGSQGARQLNEAMMALADSLSESPLTIFHQTGEADRERVSAAYEAAGIDAEVVAFEPDMPSRYAWADLALARAGALTVTELAMAGLPALLVPYPYAADDHQAANANALASAGAALCIESSPLNEGDLGKTLSGLINAPEQLVPMSQAARRLAKPNAATEIIRECVEWLEGRGTR